MRSDRRWYRGRGMRLLGLILVAALGTGAAPPGAPAAAAYDLAALPVLSKVLFYADRDYYDRGRFDFRRMLLGALDFVQRDTPEILIDRTPGGDAAQVSVTVAGRWRTFSLAGVTAIWTLRSTLQEIFRFIQENLPPGRANHEGQRRLKIEVAAVNGMLATLDPHSSLLDPATYR